MKVKYQFNDQNLAKVQEFFEGQMNLSVDYEVLKEQPANGLGKLMVATVDGHSAASLADVIREKGMEEYWNKISGNLEPYLCPIGHPDAIEVATRPEVRKALEKSREITDRIRKASRPTDKQLNTPYDL